MNNNKIQKMIYIEKVLIIYKKEYKELKKY